MPLPAGLYTVADAAFGDPVALGLSLARAGARVVQLRAKGWAPEQVEAAARVLLPELRVRGCLLIINDHLAVAATTGADGVHLGQDDRPTSIAEARAALNPGALVGRSTHTLEQVQAASDADYLGFGPIFATTTGAEGLEPRGVASLEEAVATSRVPIVAIGGITPTNVHSVRYAGAHGWAVISALVGAPDLDAAMRALR